MVFSLIVMTIFYKVRITGYGYEPWHIRYVGVDLATQLHQENKTLEEYYEG